jgi:hypothetical protein
MTEYFLREYLSKVLSKLFAAVSRK